jgi:hypothetical protein
MADEIDIRKKLMALAQPPMAQGSGGGSIEITQAQLRELRQLPDLDLVMLLSACIRREYVRGPIGGMAVQSTAA